MDPLSDIETIQTELALADLETVERALERVGKREKAGDKLAQTARAALDKTLQCLDAGGNLRSLVLTEAQRAVLAELQLLCLKPTLYVANVTEQELGGNRWTEALVLLAGREGAAILVVCAALEAALTELEDGERREYLDALGVAETGLARLIEAGYALLGLQTFFTAGPKEVRAWTTRIGATAPEAAGVIHTDFQRGFIRAEVIGYDDYLAGRGEQGAKDAGKWRLEGKNYRVRDGDVMHVRFKV